ncbi:PIR Superfamily Protein [Plasmodium ovale curtisi]|uniref:PIR Superfamily Protein n=1 Tax=Plasmodium ovale curtisi TaxID=864141 RepID=A0A1A8WPA0_PLAOA|nr:PIR Superfamily Protein [Plasmodium ovale curtisi]
MGNEDDPDINDLHSEIIYHKFDRGLKDYMHDKGDFWEYVIKIHILKDLTIFRKLAKGFYYVSTMKENEETFYDDRWNYLYFWTGSKVLESSESSSYSDIMDLLNTVKSVHDNSQFYNVDMFKVTIDEFKNLKKIYDYLQNYEPIQWKVGLSGIASCTARYKEYITTTHDLYTNEKQRCQNDTGNYCKAVKRFALTYDKNNIRKLSCDGKKDPSKQPEMEDTEEELMDSRPQDSSHSGDAQPLYSPSADGEQTRDMSSPAEDISFSSGSPNVISTVFPLLGTASLALFFLKFTPLGSRLYNSIFSKQIIRTNEEEAQETFENSYEFSNSNFEENSHHIAYHSM